MGSSTLRGWKDVAQTSDLTVREEGEITSMEDLAPSLCLKGLSVNLCRMEELGAHPRAARTARR